MRPAFTLALTLALAPPLRADPPLGYPVPAAFPTPDGRHVLVLLPPKSDDPAHKENAHHQGLRAKYPLGGGLYPADDPARRLWAADWFAHEAFPADDAASAVRVHGDNVLSRHFPGAKRLPEETVAAQLTAPGLSFYRDGELLKTYAVRELVRDPDALPHTVQHVLWMAGGTVTRDGTKFVLMTHDSWQHVFDLATGAKLESRPAGLGNAAQVWVLRVTMGVVVLAVVLTIGGYLLFGRGRAAAAGR